MPSIDSGAKRGRRTLDHSLPLVPFIDFLLCLVMFLLVTAAWSDWARLEAQAAGGAGQPLDEARRTLELDMRVAKVFVLRWKEGATVVATREVPREPNPQGEGFARYPALRDALAEVPRWANARAPRGPTSAVLFTPNSTEFAEISAVLDALRGPRPDAPLGGPAYAVAFATE